MPLEYESKVAMSLGGYSMGISKTLMQDFGSFSNYFIYNGFSLIGAVSVSPKNGRKTLVAEAKIYPYATEKGKPYNPNFLVEEFHYADGLLVFHCKSEFDKSLGMKKKEIECSGRKTRDYFFILPAGF